jgi:hypothetical protein
LDLANPCYYSRSLPRKGKRTGPIHFKSKTLIFFPRGNGTITYFTTLYMISDRYIQPKCLDFGGIQDVTGAMTSGRDWDCEQIEKS